jgi:MHS family proline/betaine transporter-like MFS transporter
MPRSPDTSEPRGPTPQAPPVPHWRRRTVLFSSVGEIVEWFDFMIYLSLVPILARVFFGETHTKTHLFAILGIFAAGYLARPHGAILFGRLGDRFGRKRALIVSALVMTGAKLVEGSLPTYDDIGIAAAVLFVVARLCSGFSLGGEFAGTLVMLFETATPRHRALTTSLANMMAGGGVLLAAGLVTALIALLTPEEMQAWGWRIPFFVGSGVGLVALAFRLWVPETPMFEEVKEEGLRARTPVKEAVKEDTGGAAVAFAMSSFIALSYFLVIAFLPTYQQSFVGMDHVSALTITTIATVLSIVVIPISGLVSDHVGRKLVLIATSLAFIVLSVPLFWLLASDQFWLAGALVLVVPAACFMAPAYTTAVEHLPTQVRFSGFALGYNVGAAIFGGTAPLIAAWLIHSTGSLTAPAGYLVLAAIAILIVCWRLKETYRLEIS